MLALALIITGVAITVIMESMRDAGDTVKVTVNGKTVGVYSLSEDGTYELNNGTNTLTVEGGYAFITKANCPSQKCVHQGKISRTGERIDCTHNRLSIVVEGEDDEIFIN